ncbi:xanthine dehydrogenase family protein molybdopterin-binding subunit [Maledivibacter halophilus]|uniref:CO or xanthine dehydrogenase, Mo-binding subunit n=1 Tax=Maledivibacter halophilus TaxID=36842 RepID=A0A1T5L1M8_9FIRM|nr:molybdopterin cofactor-binding domain-containing protein [Maledivibacter halophilus]SKC69864.1 CO or xanthine dehydrogenase, Mo-binding subunit [Maledivibacter halophilus]
MKKIDSEAILSGQPIYTDDLIFHQDTLTIKLLRSPHAFAKIKSIDIEKAKKVEGVLDIYTYRDVPQIRYSESGESYPDPTPYDRMLLEPTLRYVGDEVAIIAADDELSAKKAMKLIEVEYEVLEPVLDLTKAEGHSSILHPEDDIFCPFDFGFHGKKNIVSRFQMGKGDVEKEFNDCDVIMERSYQTQAQAHCMMETHRAYGYIDSNGRIVVISSNQSAYHMRRQSARAIGLPVSKLRFIKPRIGGGFGGKNVALAEPYVAFVTWKTKRPSKLVYTRQETFAASTSRHQMKFDMKIGSDKNGNIKAIDIKSINNTGAYGANGVVVTMEAAQNVLPIYNKVPAIRYKGKTVYTNVLSAGPLRGYGATQGTFVTDSIINELANELKMDPTEVKLKNTIRKGAKGGILKSSIKSLNIEKCIERGKKLIGWNEKYPRKEISTNKIRSVGMSIAIHGSGIANIDSAAVTLRMVEDGTYILLTGSSDLGTGSDTVLAQITAKSLNTTMDKVTIYSGDTDACPYDTGAYASCTTYLTGNAIVRASKELRDKILKKAEKKLNIPSLFLELQEDRVCHIEDESIYVLLRTLGEESVVGPGSEVLMANATYGMTESPRPFIVGFVEIELDKSTGEVKVINYVAVVDCGTVINPNLARIQVEGGITQGIGLALYEEVKYSDTGKLLTDSFLRYNVPSKKDIGNIIVDFQSDYEPTGPFGAKSIGEVVIHTPSPAIANAIYNAAGVYIRELPMTSEKIYMAMKRLREEKS